MWIIFPLLSFIFLILYVRVKYPTLGWRFAYLLAAIMLGFFSVIFLELTGLFLLVKTGVIRWCWVVVTMVSLGLLLHCLRKRTLAFPAFKSPGALLIVGLMLIGIIFLVNAFVAFVSPPNTWDSMSYHLPRVMHWAANGGVHFYPTDIPRQLFNNPGAEFFILHIFLLTGNDQWFNLLQWGSMLGCVIAVSSIAGALGASVRGQIFAAFFATTIPMAVLQSTSTQNDLFLSFWMLAFIALGLHVQKKFSRTFFYAASAALGLSILAKGTFFVLVAFVLWFGISLWGRAFKHGLVAVCIVLSIVGGFYLRCGAWNLDRSVLNKEQLGLLMVRQDPQAMLANALCQISSQVVFPLKQSKQLTEGFVHGALQWLGINDNGQGLFGQEFVMPPGPEYLFDEDYAANPLQVIMIILMPFILWQRHSKRQIWIYYICVVVGGVCFVALIKWQPFITRLHLPLLLLFTPLVGLMMDSGYWRSMLVGVLLLVMAWGMILCHHTRPFIGPNRPLQGDRKIYYFMKNRDKLEPYAKASGIITVIGCRDVGLIEGGDSWEYPLWAFTHFGQVKFRKVISSSMEEPLPCLILALDQPPKEAVDVSRVSFSKIWEQDSIQLFVNPAKN